MSASEAERPRDARFVREHPARQRVGVALSGGGIRSATFGLGVLQVLRTRGVLDQTDFVAAVSGGNYIATAHTIVAAESDPDLFDEVPPFAENSPEERWFRQHSTYLAPARSCPAPPQHRLRRGRQLPAVPALGVPPRPAHGLGVRGEAAARAQWLGGLRPCRGRRDRGPGDPRPPRRRRRAHRRAAAPGRTERPRDGPPRRGADRDQHDGCAAGCGLDGPADRRAVPRRRPALGRGRHPRGLQRPVQPGHRRPRDDRAAVQHRRLDRRVRARRSGGRPDRAAGAHRPPHRSERLPARARVGGERVARRCALPGRHEPRGSARVPGARRVVDRPRGRHRAVLRRLHAQRPLLDAPVLPGAPVDGVRDQARADRGWAARGADAGLREPLYFSCVAPKVPPSGPGYFPQLVVCAAVNLSGDDVPPGRLAASYTFEYDNSGCDVVAYHSTRQLEAFTGNRGVLLTMPGLMAISGAAVSPMMGKLTLRPLRLALALANVRLGVWLPNPERPAHRTRAPVAPALGASPPPATAAKADRPAVPRRLAQWIARGWDEPGAFYVLREGLGWMDKRSRYLYITDGGHWDNLGLVELLRRRCNRIICFDATNGTDDLEAVSQALALAAAELSVEIELVRAPELLVGDDGFASVCVTEFWYPDRSEGRLVIAKSVVTADMPADVVGFRRRDRRFPNHSTGDQLFDDEEFEADRSLGRVVAARAAEALNLRHEPKRRPASREPVSPLPRPTDDAVMVSTALANRSRWRRGEQHEPVVTPPAARSSS